MKYRKHGGFTLFELIMVLGIISILTLIAYPSYNHFILKSHRIDAMTGLIQNQIALERCYAQNRSYDPICNTLPTFPQQSEQGYYRITLSNLSAKTYTLSATAIGLQAPDTHCINFTINQTHIKTATNDDCWSI